MACGCWWKRCRNGPQFGNLVCKRREGRVVVVILFLMFEEWNAVLTDLWQTWGVPFFLGEKLIQTGGKGLRETKFYFGIVMYTNPAHLSVSPTTWLMEPTYCPAFHPQTHPDPTLQPRQDWVFYKRQSNTVYSKDGHLTAFTERSWSSAS